MGRIKIMPNHKRHSTNSTKPFSQKQITQFRIAFNMLDKNGCGTICVEDVHRLFTGLGKNLSQDEEKDIIAEYDINESGDVTFPEFLAMMSEKDRIKGKDDEYEELKAAFEVFDVDGDGYLGFEEFSNALKQIGENFSDFEVREFISLADLEENGLMDVDEFIGLLTNKYRL